MVATTAEIAGASGSRATAYACTSVGSRGGAPVSGSSQPALRLGGLIRDQSRGTSRTPARAARGDRQMTRRTLEYRGSCLASTGSPRGQTLTGWRLFQHGRPPGRDRPASKTAGSRCLRGGCGDRQGRGGRIGQRREPSDIRNLKCARMVPENWTLLATRVIRDRAPLIGTNRTTDRLVGFKETPPRREDEVRLAVPPQVVDEWNALALEFLAHSSDPFRASIRGSIHQSSRRDTRLPRS